jgi:hypothetical protein
MAGMLHVDRQSNAPAEIVPVSTGVPAPVLTLPQTAHFQNSEEAGGTASQLEESAKKAMQKEKAMLIYRWRRKMLSESACVCFSAESPA